jgi:serine/threonine protein kinase
MPVSLDKPEENIGTSPVKVTTGFPDDSPARPSSREYTVGNRLFGGDFCDIYACACPGHPLGGAPTWYDRLIEEDNQTRGVFKVVRDEKDNDLLLNECHILAKLFPTNEEDVKFYRYLPRILDYFPLPVSKRFAAIFPLYEDFVPLSDVIKAWPAGIDFRDMVWMFKRTLVGIGFAHKNGVVHGAVLPPHVLVHPTDHGAKLLDWSFAVEAGGHIHGLVGQYRDYYPPEVFDKEKALPATDIFMAAKCCVALLGGNVKTNEIPTVVPEKIRDFFYRCLVKNASRRPQDAWDLHTEFDKLLKEVVGKPTYRKLVMP